MTVRDLKKFIEENCDDDMNVEVGYEGVKGDAHSVYVKNGSLVVSED